MATFCTARGAAPEARFFVRVAPSKSPTSAALSSVAASLANPSCSCRNFSVPVGCVRPYLTQSTMAYGAG
jgi:hypothetical protein